MQGLFGNCPLVICTIDVFNPFDAPPVIEPCEVPVEAVIGFAHPRYQQTGIINKIAHDAPDRFLEQHFIHASAADDCCQKFIVILQPNNRIGAGHQLVSVAISGLLPSFERDIFIFWECYAAFEQNGLKFPR